MAEERFRDIRAIDDLFKLAQIMKSLGIPTTGLTSIDQIKMRAATGIERSRTNTDWIPGQAFSVLSQAKEEDKRKKEVLLHYYKSTLKCLENNADERLLHCLNTDFSTDIIKKVKEQRDFLKRDENIILVAGETSAGKSTLINLILGKELLPSSIPRTTATICELRYAEKPKIVLHFKKELDDGTNKSEREVPLNASGSYLAQIARYIKKVDDDDDNEGSSPYRKVVLYWPHELLEKGVVIVDSPGIGESECMDNMVIDYLTEAFCFLYVINSANATGIAKDRIVKLFVGAQTKCEERGENLLHKRALFVCNKWDIIKEEEVQEEQEEKTRTISKLKKCCPKIRTQSQIIYLSAENASTAQSYGMISDDFRLLIEGVQSMVLKAMDERLRECTTFGFQDPLTVTK